MWHSERGNRGGALAWLFAVVGLSALVGVLNAHDPAAQDSDSSAIHATAQSEPTVVEQIESTLAQAGCPGWIVLASEGEGALEPPPATDDGKIQPTAHLTANLPSVNYPAPIRVASRALFTPPTSNEPQPSITPPSDPDDLLDGMPDLLIGEDSQALEQIEEPAPPAQPVLPQATPAARTQPTPPPKQVVPSRPPQPPKKESQQQQPPALNIRQTLDSLFEGPSPPSQQEKASTTSPPAPAPQLKPQLSEPSLSLPEPRPEPKVEEVPPPPVPVQPATPQKAMPQSRVIEQKPAETFQPPAPPTLPKPPAKTQEKPTPKASPFAAPPKPKQTAPHSVGSAAKSDSEKSKGEGKTYCEFVAENCYPSAHACAKCHEKIFDEWSVSSHAYAAISPMFHKFEQTINDLSQGTIGYFCYRCHTPVGTTLGVSRATPLWELPQVAREGVTCIACHRVNQRYGKVNGERRIEPGNIFAPVYGSIGGGGIAEAIAKKDKFKVKASPHEKGPGQDIHTVGMKFDQLGRSEFCMSCHQVAVQPGIKLEVVWEQYRASPACKKGISCQDCHMGRIPGVPSGYEYGAAAKVADKVVHPQRKHANHVFFGPGYSIAHPGVFPHNKDALRWTMQDWLQFDWRAGWGTDDFEELVDEGRVHVNFPPVWKEADDRYDAREIIDDNLKKLEGKRISRQQVMENGSHVDGPFFDTPLTHGQDLKFHYVMSNTNEGHNLPSGSLGAQPQLWANVVLIGPRGQRLWESGYTDRWGDVADIHSVEVRNKRLPYDWQLFNLQTMFLITGAKGTDREFFLPVNFDFDQLPYLRPGAQPISTLNHPPFIRMEGRSLSPLGSRKIPYKVPAHLMCEPGHYRLSFRLRSRAEPIYFMRFCGSTKEMNRAMNEGMIDFHQSSVEFFVR